MAPDETLPDLDSGVTGPAGTSGTGASSPSGSGGQKVELDLDDAPFLEDDEPEQKEEPKEAAPADSTPEAPPQEAPVPQTFMQRLLANKKRLILAGAAFVLLVAAAIAVNVFMGGDDAPAPPPPPPQVEPTPVALPEGPPALPEAPAPKHVMNFAPFWVEQKDTEGNIRFLSLTFATPTDNTMLFMELGGKMVILRDALFYYLSNRPPVMIQDETIMESLKSDLMTVINEHVGNGKINDIYIQSYLIQ